MGYVKKLSLCLLVGWMMLGSQRLQAATYDVTDNSDDGVTTTTLHTIRWAVASANGNSGQDTITISVSNSITALTPLNITDPVIIEGKGNTMGSNPGVNGLFTLNTNSNNSLIRNLAIINSATGIYIFSSGNTVQGCAIGIDWAGNTYVGNNAGIISYGDNNLIGGNTPAQRNIISGNRYAGIWPVSGKGLKAQGNYIGTDLLGKTAIPNRNAGIVLETISTLIGGNSSSGEGNLISGNNYGIWMVSATGNTVAGNIIGLTADQSAVLPNSSGGMLLSGVQGNYIGLPTLGYENTIAGHSPSSGIIVTSYGVYRPSNNIIQNNYIGTTASGNTYVANSSGILVTQADSNLIGGNRGSGFFERNVISGNNQYGIYIWGSNGNTVAGNYVGLKPNGIESLGNTIDGILLLSSEGNLIGGPNTDASHMYGNVLSGQGLNNGTGLYIGTGQNNIVLGNYVGLNSAGTGAVPNDFGIWIRDANANQIGNGTAAGRNIISGNRDYGAYLLSTSGDKIIGNYFGTDIAGTAALTNGYCALQMLTASGCMVGGTSANESNILVSGASIDLEIGEASFGNTVVGNYLNVFANGTLPAVNSTYGIRMYNMAQGNSIGLKNTGQGNLIANTQQGIFLTDSTTIGNGLFGNTICAFANVATGQGIVLASGANQNKPAPSIAIAAINYVNGLAQAGDYVEVFKADRAGGYQGGSLKFIGTATADGNGAWNLVPVGLLPGDYICATASNSQNNTSPFSNNLVVSNTIMTPTPTFTPSITPTSTPTPAITITPTPNNPLANVDLHGKAMLAFPNPAKNQVQFLMHLDTASEVKIVIYNLAGERVAELKADMATGRGQTLVWNCGQTAPGIYVARMFQQQQEKAKIKLAIVR